MNARILKVVLLIMLLVAPTSFAGLIQPGQVFKLTIIGVSPSEAARLNNTYSVDDSGYVMMWEIGKVKASGLTSAALARKIEAAYRHAEIYTSLTIQIFTDSGDTLVQEQVTVGGKVRSPGAKPFQAGMTLFDAIMASGGPTDFGAINRVKLYRNDKVYTYDLTKREHKLLKMYPRDTVDVPMKNWLGQ